MVRRCVYVHGKGEKFHYESEDKYKMITEITSLGWWQVEPFRPRTLDLVVVTFNIDRLLRLPILQHS